MTVEGVAIDLKVLDVAIFRPAEERRKTEANLAKVAEDRITSCK